jgi:hypothetical protein
MTPLDVVFRYGRTPGPLELQAIKSPGTKEFIIQSETGSKLIIDRVFKKLLQSEKEALVLVLHLHEREAACSTCCVAGDGYSFHDTEGLE